VRRQAVRRLCTEQAESHWSCVTLREERRIEEAPQACKPIGPVIQVQEEAGMIRGAVRLKPWVTFKVRAIAAIQNEAQHTPQVDADPMASLWLLASWRHRSLVGVRTASPVNPRPPSGMPPLEQTRQDGHGGLVGRRVLRRQVP